MKSQEQPFDIEERTREVLEDAGKMLNITDIRYMAIAEAIKGLPVNYGKRFKIDDHVLTIIRHPNAFGYDLDLSGGEGENITPSNII